MSSARAFHILTVRVKKDLWYVVVLHFLGTNRVTFVLLLDLVALERTRLVGITVGLGRGRTVALFFLCRVISCPTNMSRHLQHRSLAGRTCTT